MNNEGKVQNIRSISLRNLYLAPSNHTADDADRFKAVEDVRPRRMSLIQTVPELERPGTHLELFDINNRTLLDSFVSLHLADASSKLLYVSEVRECTMNPNFSDFTLPVLPRKTHAVVVKVWCKHHLVPSAWQLLSVLKADLRRLECFGDTAENLEDWFHPNSIIFNLSGKLFTVPNSLGPSSKRIRRNKHVRTMSSKQIRSYTIDDLRALTNLARSLQELTIAKHRLSRQIENNIDVLYDASSINNISITVDKLRSQVASLDGALSKQRSRNDSYTSQILGSKIRANQIKQLCTEKKHSITEMSTSQTELAQAQADPIKEALCNVVYPSMIEQLQEYAAILRDVFSIRNVSNSVRFSIVDVPFPASMRELLETCYYNNGPTGGPHEHNVQCINSGLSYIISLINLLADITNTNLKYKMVSCGNESVIIDPIVTGKRQQGTSYPLHYDQMATEKLASGADAVGGPLMKNAAFEQGLGMLHKNLFYLIARITSIYAELRWEDGGAAASGQSAVPVDCPDNFLWNLQYLILFITAS